MRGHRRVALLEDLPVAVRLPQRPGHPDPGVTPDRGRGVRRPAGGVVEQLEDVGHDQRHDVVRGPLLGGQVQQPVAQEGRHVEQVGRGRGEDGDVTGPALPLVPLRAVGRQIEEVAPLTPHHVAVQLVDEIVGAGEGADPRQVGVHDHGDHVLGADRLAQTGHLGVAEAVEGQGGLEDVQPAAADEGVGRPGRPQRPGAELVVLDHLGVPDGDRRCRPRRCVVILSQPTRF